MAVVLLVVGVAGSLAIGHPVPLVLLPFAAAVGAASWRVLTMSVIAEPEVVIVRNLVSTKRVPRRLIRSFRVGGRRREYPGRALRAVLADGSTIVLAATGRYVGPYDDLDSLVTDLTDWLRKPLTTFG